MQPSIWPLISLRSLAAEASLCTLCAMCVCKPTSSRCLLLCTRARVRANCRFKFSLEFSFLAADYLDNEQRATHGHSIKGLPPTAAAVVDVTKSKCTRHSAALVAVGVAGERLDRRLGLIYVRRVCENCGTQCTLLERSRRRHRIVGEAICSVRSMPLPRSQQQMCCTSKSICNVVCKDLRYTYMHTH